MFSRSVDWKVELEEEHSPREDKVTLEKEAKVIGHKAPLALKHIDPADFNFLDKQ